jgi:hypothetical protein
VKVLVAVKLLAKSAALGCRVVGRACRCMDKVSGQQQQVYTGISSCAAM